MESAGNVAVMPAAFPWSDWGTWTAWEATLPADRRGNRVFGNARVEDCAGTTAVGADPRRPLVVAGARDHLVVQAPAGLLVCRRDQADDLKKLLGGSR
jgi:mannose-1-phosphate guanylyltransferase